MSAMEGLDPGYLNAGLMKPRRGLTPTTGKKKLGVGKESAWLDRKGRVNYEFRTFRVR